MPLTLNGSALGLGKVLQVVQGTTNTQASTSSTTAVTTGLQASITPSSASSKILVIAHTAAAQNNSTWIGAFGLFRGGMGGTNLGSFASLATPAGTSGSIQWPVSIAYLDSPATTSSTTYVLSMLVANAAASVVAQANNYMATMILVEVAP